MKWWLLGLPVSLCALPSGGVVLSGDVNFVYSSQTVEVQAQGEAVIQWSSFDIAEGESVTFHQLDGISSIENQVDGAMSLCAGDCSSDAPLILINDQGWSWASAATGHVHSLTLQGLAGIDFQGELAAEQKVVFSAGAGECRIGGSVLAPRGVIRLDGQLVHLSGSAQVNVSSPSGGGVISVMQGIPMIEVDAGAKLEASGQDAGTGGSIYLYADNELFFYGEAVARGGDLRGNGGKISLTGWNALHVPEEGPQVDVSAPMGRPGIVKIYSGEAN